MSSSQLTVENVLGVFRRRILLMIGFAVLFGALALGGSYLVPSRYVSQTLILIRRQTVPEDLVKPVVTDDVSSELATMKQQILSRSNLLPLVNSLKLFPSDPSIESRVDSLRKNIAIVPLGGDYEHAMNAFTVSCRADSAASAQALCSEITSLFISRNLNDRQQSAEDTNNFLKQQLGEARQDLTDENHKMASLQQKDDGMLPEEENANAASLQSLLVQHNAAILAITQIEQELADLGPAAARTPAGSPLAPGAVAGPYDAQIAELRKTQAEMLRTYTPDHPDVVAVVQQIKDLESANAAVAPAPRIADTHISPAHAPQPAQANQSPASRLQAELQVKKAEVDQLDRKINLCQTKMDGGPAVAEQYRQITRGHQVTASFYDSLEHKMNDSSLAVNLQNQQQGEQFQLIDPANLPNAPEFPKHQRIGLLGLIGGFLAGLAMAFFFELKNPVITTETSLVDLLGIPVLGNISTVAKTAKRRRQISFLLFRGAR